MGNKMPFHQHTHYHYLPHCRLFHSLKEYIFPLATCILQVYRMLSVHYNKSRE